VRKISIAQRFRPFSHQPGARSLLPGTSLVIQAFPTLIRIEGLCELPLDLSGPVREFTLQQDLEKGLVAIWGKAKEKHFQIKIQAEQDVVAISGLIEKKIPYSSFQPSLPLERLSLGNHRAQDWAQVMRRFDVRQILPILYHLSQWTPSVKGAVQEIEDWESFLHARFSGILVPRLFDDEYQGLLPPLEGDPYSLVVEAKKQIRALFFEQRGKQLHCLPSSPFSVGRMTDVRVEGVGTIDFEWKKRDQVRSFVLRAMHDAEIEVLGPTFRLRSPRQEKSFRVQKRFEVRTGEIYFADRFQESR